MQVFTFNATVLPGNTKGGRTMQKFVSYSHCVTHILPSTNGLLHNASTSRLHCRNMESVFVSGWMACTYDAAPAAVVGGDDTEWRLNSDCAGDWFNDETVTPREQSWDEVDKDNSKTTACYIEGTIIGLASTQNEFTADQWTCPMRTRVAYGSRVLPPNAEYSSEPNACTQGEALRLTYQRSDKTLLASIYEENYRRNSLRTRDSLKPDHSVLFIV